MLARRTVGVSARLRWLPVVLGVIALVLAVPLYRTVTEERSTEEPGVDATGSPSTSQATANPEGEAGEEDLRAIADIVVDPGAQPGDARWLRQGLGPVYVAFRRAGVVTGSGWADGGDVASSLAAAVREARDQEEGEEGDVAEVCVSHSYRDVDRSDGALDPIHAGVLGVEVSANGRLARYSPTLMVANNWDADDALERYARAQAGIDVGDLGSTVGRVAVFGCEQFLVELSDAPPVARRMFRGNVVVHPDEVTEASVQALADDMGGWLVRSLHPDGRMTYKYWPSARRESDANNMIRQWMASVALVRWSRFNDDAHVVDLARRNIRYNLDRFYEERDGLGLILYDEKVKLGAVALAALAIVEHPDRDDFAHEEAALRRTVNHLWNDDGSFDTFLVPEGRNDNQNFYPGEALVLWAHLLAIESDAELAERFASSFRYYRDWHLDEDNRNPAFVPWHTQAYFQRWQQTEDPELREFIFEMNDWLLSMQQWDDVPYPDVRGRFYDPQRPGFGVPHASSTGVYLEGLADAHRLALETGDQQRAERYARAIRRGLRSVMQLQFADDVDLYYVAEPDRVRGGVRTTVYDNEIRVDNVQHNLVAVMKLLAGSPALQVDLAS